MLQTVFVIIFVQELYQSHGRGSIGIAAKILYTYVGEQSSQDMTTRQNTVTPASVLPPGIKLPSVCNY